VECSYWSVSDNQPAGHASPDGWSGDTPYGVGDSTTSDVGVAVTPAAGVPETVGVSMPGVTSAPGVPRGCVGTGLAISMAAVGVGVAAGAQADRAKASATSNAATRYFFSTSIYLLFVSRRHVHSQAKAGEAFAWNHRQGACSTRL
jgi:hypothetical protein